MNRDGWGFQGFPYYQMRLEMPEFRGMVCLIELRSGERCYWHMPRAGKVAVCGAGMKWLQLIPDGANHVLTAKMTATGRVNVWYADVVAGVDPDPDGVMTFTDLYLDVIFSPEGDVKIDDRDELDAALQSGEVTESQHAMALTEGERVMAAYCENLKATQAWCRRLLRQAEKQRSAPQTLRWNA